MSDSLQLHGLLLTRLLCPWKSPGKKTGVSCNVLLQGNFPTVGLNPRLLHFLYWPLVPPGKPHKPRKMVFKNEDKFILCAALLMFTLKSANQLNSQMFHIYILRLNKKGNKRAHVCTYLQNLVRFHHSTTSPTTTHDLNERVSE